MFLKAVSLLSQINLYEIRHLKEVHRIKHKNLFDFESCNRYFGNIDIAVPSQENLALSDFNLCIIYCSTAELYSLNFKDCKINLDLRVDSNFLELVVAALQTDICNNIYRLKIDSIIWLRIDIQRQFLELYNKFSYLHTLCFEYKYQEYMDEKKLFNYLILFVETCKNIHVLHYENYIDSNVVYSDVIENELYSKFKKLIIHSEFTLEDEYKTYGTYDNFQNLFVEKLTCKKQNSLYYNILQMKKNQKLKLL